MARKNSFWDKYGAYILIAGGIALSFLPYPTDVLDFGTPLIEIVATMVGIAMEVKKK